MTVKEMTAVVAALMMVAVFGAFNTVQARGRTVSVTGARGRTCTRSVQRGFTSAGYQRSVTSTGPAGYSTSHGSTATITGNGIADINTQVYPSYAGSAGRTTTVTGPGGNTASRAVQRGFNSEGYQRSVTTTGPAGRSGTRTSTTTVTP